MNMVVNNQHFDEVLSVSDGDSTEVPSPERRDTSWTTKSAVSDWNDNGRSRLPDGIDGESPTRSVGATKNKQYDSVVDDSDCSSIDTRSSSLRMDERPDVHPPSDHTLSRVSSVEERNLRFVSDRKDRDVLSHRLRSTHDSCSTSSSGGSEGSEKSSFRSKLTDYNDHNSSMHQDLGVTDEQGQVIQYIEEFKPPKLDLDTSLKCFIPEYKPAIGEPDAFLKMPRPDGERDKLGLEVLDEPASDQSDAAVMELQLRTLSKERHNNDVPVVVRSIENASKNPMEIEKFIKSMKGIHREPTQVNYKNPMPTVEKVLEPWPPELQQAIRDGTVVLPDPNMDLSLDDYAKVLFSLLDIPVHDGSLIESLHLMFDSFIESQSLPFALMRNIKDGDADEASALGLSTSS